ncbi:hypothetical protein AS200_00550 [Streptomyces sp. CdTB01]|nr:hypothetical protein AS200_00550 [Streptomyces sp. CdTB01]
MSQPWVRSAAQRFGIGVNRLVRECAGRFKVDAEGGGVLDEVLTVVAVDPDLAQSDVVGGGLLREGAAGGEALDAGRSDQHSSTDGSMRA